jgi:aminopeptidase-like protein
MMNLLAYADGKSDLLTIAETIGVPALHVASIAEILAAASLLEDVSPV